VDLFEIAIAKPLKTLVYQDFFIKNNESVLLSKLQWLATSKGRSFKILSLWREYLRNFAQIWRAAMGQSQSDSVAKGEIPIITSSKNSSAVEIQVFSAT